MPRVLSVNTLFIATAVLLSGCAVNNGSEGGVGASAAYSKKRSVRNCDTVNGQLRKLEARGRLYTKEYERVLDRYLNMNCYAAET